MQPRGILVELSFLRDDTAMSAAERAKATGGALDSNLLFILTSEIRFSSWSELPLHSSRADSNRIN